jgi:2-dehydro-3-deoxyphosphogluconate aldolase/(4S)-4-hydroxy-2-oxoglutarate aldolase
MTAVLDRLAGHRVLPVAEIERLDQVGPLVDALSAAGLPCIEVTLRTPVAIEAIRLIRVRHPDVLVAAGTVLTVNDVDQALDAGAEFLVSPGLNPTVVDHAHRRGATFIPGACTPTEVEAAMTAGASVVKFFPAELAGGIPFVQALAAPYPTVRFVPTGGISAANLAEYLALPNVVACGGSWMVRRDLLAADDFAAIERLAREAVEIAATTATTSG